MDHRLRGLLSFLNFLRNLLSSLTIIPRARMGSESIAHEAEGRMGYNSGAVRARGIIVLVNLTSWSKISRTKKF